MGTDLMSVRVQLIDSNGSIWALEEFVNNFAPEGLELMQRITALEEYMRAHSHFTGSPLRPDQLFNSGS